MSMRSYWPRTRSGKPGYCLRELRAAVVGPANAMEASRVEGVGGRLRRGWSWLWIAAGLAACAQAPVPVVAPPPPAPAPLPEARQPEPKVRGVNPADLPREEPGVGVGGLTHEAPDSPHSEQPASP